MDKQIEAKTVPRTDLNMTGEARPDHSLLDDEQEQEYVTTQLCFLTTPQKSFLRIDYVLCDGILMAFPISKIPEVWPIQSHHTDSKTIQSSNPMAESSDVGAATVAIPPAIHLRPEAGVPAPITHNRNLPLPTSIASYNRRLSRESREEMKKTREMLQRAERDP
jgi:hypothetical protein